MDGVKISEIPGAMISKKVCNGCGKAHSSKNLSAGGFVSCCPDGLYSEQEYNQGLTDQGQVRLSLSREKLARKLMKIECTLTDLNTSWETCTEELKKDFFIRADAIIYEQKSLFVVVKP